MGNGPDDEGEAFHRAAWFSGQANHQRLVHDHREVAREDGVFGDLHGFGAHDFAEAREFAHGDLAHGFGCDIAQGNTGAAGGEDKLAPLGDKFANGSLDVAFLVGNE